MAEGTSTTSLPARVGRFEVLRLLQEGGMGRLYVARHPTLHQDVVLKTLTARARRHGTAAVARLRREAEILAKLRHDGLCPVLDFFEEEGEQYVVLPFIEGEDLSVRVARAARLRNAGGTLADAWSALLDDDERTPSTAGGLAKVLALMEELARAVHVAHEGAVIHRDLKPSNVMVRRDGRPVVLDFGVALDRDSATPAITEGHSTPGTIFYMSPEQLRGRREEVSRRSDVYSLGTILYEVLTLRRAVGATNTDAVIAQILGGHIDPPRRGASEIPPDVEAVCLKALEREPEQRYATALEFAEELRRARLGEPTVARPLNPLTRAVRWARRNPTFATTGSVALVAVVAATIGLGLLSGERARSTHIFDRYTDDVGFMIEMLQRPQVEGGISREQHDRLAKILPDDVDQLLFAAPLDAAQMRRLLDKMKAGYRGGHEEFSITPLQPIAGVLGDQPLFRFRVEQLARPGTTLEVEVDFEDGPRVIGAAVARNAGDTLEVALPPDLHLKTGVRHDWSVHPASDDEFTGWKTPFQRFTVVDPKRHAEALRSLPKTGDAGADALLRAAACFSLGLGQATLDELAGVPPDPRLERRRLLLEAQARQLLQDDEGASAIVEKLFPK